MKYPTMTEPQFDGQGRAVMYTGSKMENAKNCNTDESYDRLNIFIDVFIYFFFFSRLLKVKLCQHIEAIPVYLHPHPIVPFAALALPLEPQAKSTSQTTTP